MTEFSVLVRAIHIETWSVKAKDEAEVRKKIADLTEDVYVDETGGEIVDWEITSIKEVTT